MPIKQPKKSREHRNMRDPYKRIATFWDSGLDLRWGKNKLLKFRGEPIFNGKMNGIVSRVVDAYAKMSVAKLRAREPLDTGRWGSRQGAELANYLYALFRAADRRIGWNDLSVWLFMEVDPIVRSIVSARVYGVAQLQSPQDH
jgi:hypothetical protein